MSCYSLIAKYIRCINFLEYLKASFHSIAFAVRDLKMCYFSSCNWALWLWNMRTQKLHPSELIMSFKSTENVIMLSHLCTRKEYDRCNTIFIIILQETQQQKGKTTIILKLKKVLKRKLHHRSLNHKWQVELQEKINGHGWIHQRSLCLISAPWSFPQ